MEENKQESKVGSELISKKELLALYGISYGTLYRWKRMGLIPEEWLVKKSTFTGQETYFYREQICRRFDEILSKKDSVTLEELSKQIVKKSEEIPKLKITTTQCEKVFYLTDVKNITLEISGREISLMALINPTGNDDNNGRK